MLTRFDKISQGARENKRAEKQDRNPATRRVARAGASVGPQLRGARFDHAGSDSLNPAPGYRDFGRTGWEGIARTIGNYGYSWSSATNSTNSMFLDFSTQRLYPSGACSRAYGLQLRCLSE